MDIDLGWTVWLHSQRIRLAHINAPELSTDAGKVAAQYLMTLLEAWRTPPIVTIETLKDRQDNYGRYLGIVITAGGVNVNEAMVASGHAVPYPAPPREGTP